MPISDRFVTLDGMRGVAALIVAALHVFGMVGLDFAPHANLAVDFFFVLSGFVIAHAYGERLGRSMTPVEFLRRRLIRLHPLIILSSAIALVTLAARSVAAGGQDLPTIVGAGAASVLLLPFHALPPEEAFPLNGPAWSLFAEYAVSILFAGIALHLTFKRLSMLITAGFGMLLGLLAWHGTVGDVWRSDTIWLSLLRVVYPFFVGVLINRLHRSGRLNVPDLPAWMPVCGLTAVLLAPSSRFDMLYELAMIAVAFPLLVVAGVRDSGGATATKLMLLGGALSYPIYMLHYPVGKAVAPLVLSLLPGAWAGAAAAAILAIVIGISWLALRHFDEPVRAWLSNRLRSAKPARSLA